MKRHFENGEGQRVSSNVIASFRFRWVFMDVLVTSSSIVFPYVFRAPLHPFQEYEADGYKQGMAPVGIQHLPTGCHWAKVRWRVKAEMAAIIKFQFHSFS